MTDAEQDPAARLERALLNPAAVYATPAEVIADGALSPAQRIEILRRWEYDASEAAVAVEEGMPDGDTDLLHQILKALEQVGANVDVGDVGPTKQHGIPRSAVKPR